QGGYCETSLLKHVRVLSQKVNLGDVRLSNANPYHARPGAKIKHEIAVSSGRSLLAGLLSGSLNCELRELLRRLGGKERKAVGQKTRVTLTFEVSVPAFDPFIPGDGPPREEKLLGIEHGPAAYKISVLVLEGQQIVTFPKVVRDHFAVHMVFADDQAMIGYVVTGNVGR